MPDINKFTAGSRLKPDISFDQIPIGTPAEALDQEIDEHAYFQRKMPRFGIDRVDRNLGIREAALV
jgi:hypothetical protein